MALTLERFRANLSRAKVDNHALMAKVGFTVEKAAKEEAPVRTGNLRRSISSKVASDGNSVRIGTPGGAKSYAAAVHEGHREIHGNPYLVFKIDGHWVKTRKVKAVAGNPFLTRGMSKSRAEINTLMKAAGHTYLESLTK